MNYTKSTDGAVLIAVHKYRLTLEEIGAYQLIRLHMGFENLSEIDLDDDLKMSEIINSSEGFWLLHKAIIKKMFEKNGHLFAIKELREWGDALNKTSEIKRQAALSRWQKQDKEQPKSVELPKSPTRAGEICRILRQGNIANVNPSHPKLLMLVDASIEDSVVAYSIGEAHRHKKPNYGYCLSIMQSTLENPQKKIVAKKSSVSEYMQSYKDAMNEKGISVDDDVIDNARIGEME